MKCVETNELKQFATGRLSPERLVAVDEHLSGCPICRTALRGMAALRHACAGLGASLLGVNDCPEPEDLSSFVDATLDAVRMREIEAHANACELCAADISQIREIRSHAAMREPVIVTPGGSTNSRGSLTIWRRAFAAVATAGVVAALVLTFGNFGNTPKSNPADIAQAPENAAPAISTPNTGPALEKPANVALKPEATPGEMTGTPTYRTVIRDGQYQVVSRDGKFVLAKVDGKSIRTPLEARIVASIEEKLRTGKIKPVESVRVAMNTIHLRAGEAYTPPATAPTPVEPTGKIVMSNTPTFTWSKVDLAQSYRLVVTDKAGNTVFQGTTDKNTLTLSSPLARGQVYSWQASARFSEGDEWANSAAAKFKVLTAEDMAAIQKIKSSVPGSHLALGAAYESFGLYEDAAREYRALRRSNPGSPLARKLLMSTVRPEL